MMDSLISQVQFTGQARSRLAFADPTQQANHLGWSQLLVRKQGAGIDRVHTLTVTTAMPCDMATAGSSEDPCLLHTRSTLRTAQSLWVKIFSQPDLAQRVVAYIENRKVHVRSVSP